jgi:hypothetical protein
MEVVSFRVPKEIKEEMKKVDINWSEEIRKFIERKLREYARKEALREIDSFLAELRAERGTASKYVREDRDIN